MDRICHRCHAALLVDAIVLDGQPASSSDDERPLFCSHCGAPQILLPEYMRSEVPAAHQTSGKAAPPNPRSIDWPGVLRCALPVALLTAVLATAGLKLPVATFLNTFTIIGGAGVVLGFYRTRRPLAPIDGRIGLRVGLVTGLLMIAAMGIALGATGVVERYVIHGTAAFDADTAGTFRNLSVQWDAQLQAQGRSAQTRQKAVGYLASPEVRAGLSFFSLTCMTGFILAITTFCGGFSGLLQTRRRSAQT